MRRHLIGAGALHDEQLFGPVQPTNLVREQELPASSPPAAVPRPRSAVLAPVTHAARRVLGLDRDRRLARSSREVLAHLEVVHPERLQHVRVHEERPHASSYRALSVATSWRKSQNCTPYPCTSATWRSTSPTRPRFWTSSIMTTTRLRTTGKIALAPVLSFPIAFNGRVSLTDEHE